MVDEKTEHSDTSRATSSLQQNEDAGGHQFLAYQSSPLQTVDGGLFPEKEGLQLADQAIPVARGSGPAQASNVATRMSHNGDENQQSPIARLVQCKTISKNPSTHPYISESVHAATSRGPIPPVSPLPPQTQNAASFSPFPGNAALAQPLSQTTVPPSLAQTACPVSRLANLIPLSPVPRDQVISVSRGTALAQASNASSGLCLKRFATQPCPKIAPAIRSKIRPSVPASAQAAPLPPLAHTAVSRPSITQTIDFCQNLSMTRAPLPSPVQTAQVSNASVGPYLKRRATQTLSTIARAVRKRIDPSVPTSVQAAPHLAYPTQITSVPSLSQTAASRPSYARTNYRQILSLTHAPLPSPVPTAHPGIPQDLDMTRPPSEPKCPLCRTNLELQQAFIGLPCNHRYHPQCLQRIISAEGTENPACIACDIGEIID